MERFCIPATTRASFAMYNTRWEVDQLVDALKRLRDEGPRARSAPAASSGTLEWPKAAAASPQAAADELAEVFDLLDDRDAKNEYVLELGAKLPATFDLLKRITPRVQGCMSEVYLVGRKSPGSGDVFDFLADANADIVRGLIAILQKLYSGQHTGDILAFDIEGFFHRIGLDQFISSQRRNGLSGMIRRIRSDVQQIARPS
jgi:cysteine desulfurase / selenocysteine lyase